MKLHNLFLTVMTLVVAVSNCQKIDNPIQDNPIKVEFTIADKPVLGDNGQTKALKTDWAVNDSIVFIFKKNTGEWCGTTLYLKGWATKYNGTQWSDLTIVPADNSLGETGTFIAIHHRGNILKSTGILSKRAQQEDSHYPLENYKGGEFMMYRGTYTVTDGVLSLGTVNMTIDSRLFQISAAKALTNQSAQSFPADQKESGMKNSTMHIERWTESGTSHFAMNITGMSRGMLYIKPDELNVFYWEENNTIPAAAIENGNDVSYLFAHNTSSGNQLDRWKFIIEGSYTPSGGVKTDFAIERFISNSDKDMVAGKAYRLPTSGWSNVE